jgi:prolyl 4-hydroxylase
VRIEVIRTRAPLLCLLHDFVTPVEAVHLEARAKNAFVRSSVVCDEPGGRCVNPSRTSESAYLSEDEVTRQIQARAKWVSNRPVCEALQLVRYAPGQEFKPHFDQFDPNTAAGAAEIQKNGQRRATILVYLGTDCTGGETVFPALGMSVRPLKYAGVYWTHQTADGRTEPNTLHGGAPVKAGRKLAMNIWLR